MIEFFHSGGVMMWPILACGVLVLMFAGRAGAGLAGAGQRAAAHLRSDADSVLLWGFSGAVLGVLGTLAGVAQMASAIERAGQVQTSTVWSGIKVTLSTSMMGIGTLMLALLLWMSLRAALGRRVQPS